MERINVFLDNLLASSTPDQPAWNKEMQREKSQAKWNYIDGCMLLAILDLYEVTKDDKYLSFVDHYTDYYIGEDGSILGYVESDYNSDNINGGKVLFVLWKKLKKEKYKKAIDRLYHQIQTMPRIPEGNFWHKQIYPNQIWLDGLYMIEPFYMEYATEWDHKEKYLDIYLQFKNVWDMMRDPATGLLYHGYDSLRKQPWADKQTGVSANFWSRSLGWYAMALVDTLEQMDEQLFFEYDDLQRQLKSLLDALLLVQDKDTKLFFQVTDALNAEGNYLESSSSCAIAYTLMKGARLGYLPSYYYNYGSEIFDSICANKLSFDAENQLCLGDICLVAGLGGMPGQGTYKERDGSYAYYISEPIVENDAKGVAPFLFAYSEILKHGHDNERR